MREGFLPTRPKTIACTPTIPHKVTDVSIYDRGPGHPRHGAELRRIHFPETVRKVPKVGQTWPSRAPKRRYGTHLGPNLPAEPTFGALPKPLFGQFLHALR